MRRAITGCYVAGYRSSAIADLTRLWEELKPHHPYFFATSLWDNNANTYNKIFYQDWLKIIIKLIQMPDNHGIAISLEIIRNTCDIEYLKTLQQYLVDQGYIGQAWLRKYEQCHLAVTNRIFSLRNASEHLGYILKRPNEIENNQLELTANEYAMLRQFTQVYDFGLCRFEVGGKGIVFSVNIEDYTLWWTEYASKAFYTDLSPENTEITIRYLKTLPTPHSVRSEATSSEFDLRLSHTDLIKLGRITSLVGIKSIVSGQYSGHCPFEARVDVAHYCQWWEQKISSLARLGLYSEYRPLEPLRELTEQPRFDFKSLTK